MGNADRDVGPPGLLRPSTKGLGMLSLRAESAAAMKTTMYREAAEAPDCVEKQLQLNADTLARLAEQLRAHPPVAMATIGRGSSDHASTYARYLVETRLGVLASSLSPSIFSVFKAPLSLANMLCLVIS